MKQWAKFDRFDFLIYLINYPGQIIGNYVIFGPRYFQDFSLFTATTLVINLCCLVTFVQLTLWMKYMRFRFSATDQFGQRLLYSMLMYVATTIVLVLAVCWIYARIGYPCPPEIIPWLLLIGITSNIISAGCHETIFTYNQLRQSTQREYALKQLHLQQQMEVLKQQVNPHFLFNSLNSLLALIRKNPVLAERFTEELSSVYRYVLRANGSDRSAGAGLDQNLTDLTSELEFIHSYSHLLQTRYGNGFELSIQVDQRFNRYQLPPLTLQLLIENAVKHNVVLTSKPLRVEIQTDELANLHVRNNLQPKKQGVLSNGMGLANIMAKYEMLGQAKPSVREEAGQFVVALPLIPV
ncbi:sensor histidine kinase [Larkinella terrae]|uniref:Sensor protein lytS n=1 Tax=Larkinella terrae TaxID=2025311 RepID=A0A7K0EEH6_9BACT|nr:histidine kinase [Larkinella terrae]MRS60240.1 sensor protein lytS [Larkinella terrae]